MNPQIQNKFYVEPVSYTHLLEGVAVGEQLVHISDITRVKVAYVQAGEGAAVGEHVVHSDDLARIESA